MNDRILFAGTNSGCGKTTITIACMKALLNRGLKVASFKCGPDYIDPMYHKKTLGIPAFNLDPYFCDEKKLQDLLSIGMSDCDIAVIEGVMGYYDGIGTTGACSTYDVAKAIDAPTVLIVNAKGMSQSVCAMLRGFLHYKNPSHIRGVIFNHVSKGMYPFMAQLAESEGIEALGYFPDDEEISVGSRHLGLLTADEVEDLEKKIDKLGRIAEECLNLDRIMEIAKIDYVNYERDINADFTKKDDGALSKQSNYVNLAIAKDKTFCFLYDENIMLLEKYGCKIHYFSPLEDEVLPNDCDGIYIPGGYPENYVNQLSQNTSMLSSIKEAIKCGIPTIAECGGFMYLQESLDDQPMVSIIPGNAKKKERLVRFGYGEMSAKHDTLILKKGQKLRIHEFHYFDSEQNGEDFSVTKASNKSQYDCGFGTDTLYAGYPHLYFPANEQVVKNFVDAMRKRRG